MQISRNYAIKKLLCTCFSGCLKSVPALLQGLNPCRMKAFFISGSLKT
jgi:hypothetical protein